ncbi:LysM peptidoglycan-binding domain-containing protein [Flammeovirgaceae bacterium SG7u.111]|nr:LysM peptidoglycan-binding domain-containing protein [Flammeovirgaceae bacterium SG7u.132]WPO34710.1 LysM peptidoglycan-binding domain-containing protein [Flammeovirgaceae bacterium SG7u.111]
MTTNSKGLVHGNGLYQHFLTSTKEENTCAALGNKTSYTRLALVTLASIYFLFLFSASTLFANNDNERYHRVKEGETIQKIARRYGIPETVLMKNNDLYSGTLHAGQLLLVSIEASTTTIASNTGRQSKLTGLSGGMTSTSTAYDPANPMVRREAPRKQITNKTITSQPENNAVAYQQVIANETPSKIQKLPGLTTETQLTSEVPNGINDAREIFKVEQETTNQPWFNLYFRTMRIARFRDNVPSKYTKRKDGIQYSGGTKVTEDLISNFGYPKEAAAALSFVSSNEGGVSDLNFYDGAGSFGFIQFTLKYGSLENYLAIVKNDKPEIFQACLAQYGFDLEISTDRYGKVKNTLVVYAPEGFKGKTKLQGDDLMDYLLANKQLFGPLILLGEQTKGEQIKAAYEMYYLVAKNINLPVNGINMITGDLFDTKAGVTALTDLCVKLGATGASNELATAVAKVMSDNGINSYNDLKGFDELAIIKTLTMTTSNDLVKRRMSKLLAENQMSALVGR